MSVSSNPLSHNETGPFVSSAADAMLRKLGRRADSTSPPRLRWSRRSFAVPSKANPGCCHHLSH